MPRRKGTVSVEQPTPAGGLSPASRKGSRGRDGAGSSANLGFGANESIVGDRTLEWFGEPGAAVGQGPHHAPSEPVADREPVSDMVLVGLTGVRELRLGQGLSQEDLADRAGPHRTAVSFIERAQRSATLETVARLASALGVEPADLMPKLRGRRTGR